MNNAIFQMLDYALLFIREFLAAVAYMGIKTGH
jgi:hypothetical protein